MISAGGALRAAIPVAALALLFDVGAPSAQTQTVVDLPTRPGVTLRYLAMVPASAPTAAVILFTGGQGVANIPDEPGPGWARNGAFVVRARERFRQHGLFVAVVDAPSDRKDGLGAFRLSADHAEDIAAVIADVRRRSGGVSVWLVGTSRGTVSTASIAAQLQPPRGADGLVLTAAVTRPGGGRQPRAGVIETVFDSNLAAIRVPTLVVGHSGDQCYVTPPADAAGIVRKLANAPRSEFIMIDGGDPPRSEPCEALSAHGFLGREDETVRAIVDWMLKPKT